MSESHPDQNVVTHPHVLIDMPEDGYIECWGWIEATVDEDEARKHLAEFTSDADGKQFVPAGPATKVWLYLTNPKAEWEYQRWHECTARRKGATAFWKIDCTVGGNQ